jgi:hypothetical protein
MLLWKASTIDTILTVPRDMAIDHGCMATVVSAGDGCDRVKSKAAR